MLFHRKIGVFVEIERQTVEFSLSGMNEPFVVEEMVSEMDPCRIPGAVSALREDERDLRLGQNLFILLRDETPVEDESRSGGIDLGEGSDEGGDIPDRAWQGADHHGKTGVRRAEERDVDLREPDAFDVVAELGEIDGIGVGEDEREIVNELLRLRGEMPKHRLLGGAVAADSGEDAGEAAGVAVCGDGKDIVEFLPGIPNPGERGISRDPGEDQGDDLLPTGRERLLENREHLAELFGHQGGIPVFMNATGIHRDALYFSSFGDETLVFRESAEILADLLWRFGCLVVDACRPVDVGFALDLLDLKTLLSLLPLLLQPRPNPLFHM